jgi:hypothetical protein
MTIGKYTVHVLRDGPVWQGHWVVHYHCHDPIDARWAAENVPLTPVVKRIELRGLGAPVTIYDRDNPKAWA